MTGSDLVPTSPSTGEPFDWLQLAFVDVLGNARSLEVPGACFDEAVRTGVVFDGSALEGPARYLEVDMRLQAQPGTLIDLGQGRARVIGAVLTTGGRPWRGDPRAALVEVLDDLPAALDGCTVAAELEFYLLDGEGQPVDRGAYFEDVGGLGPRVVRDAADILQGYGTEVVGCHHEAGPGQYEIDLGPTSPLAMADALVVAKHTIRRVARLAGLTATFMASPPGGGSGSGLHLHQRADALMTPTDGALTDAGRGFVAGQLAHARALSALAAPNVNSYRRLNSGAEAPSAAIWGYSNRAALIRVARDLGPQSSIEFRGADPAANPYLLLTGLLTTGADGVQGDLELPAANDEQFGTFEPASAVRFEPLPRHLDEALDALVADEVVTDAFDPLLVEILVTGRRAEVQEYRSRTTSWEVERYLTEA